MPPKPPKPFKLPRTPEEMVAAAQARQRQAMAKMGEQLWPIELGNHVAAILDGKDSVSREELLTHFEAVARTSKNESKRLIAEGVIRRLRPGSPRTDLAKP